MNKEEKILCPSYRCKPGAQLLGVRQDDGTVAILPQPLPIDEEFIQEVSEHETHPEQRFRFTGKCIEHGCGQWTGKSCGVAERILTQINNLTVSPDLPQCSIRPQCRWYLQSGADACKICPFVITEVTQDEIKNAMIEKTNMY